MSLLDIPFIVATVDATAAAAADPAAAQQIVEPMFVKILATTLFAIAVIHTFVVKKFAQWAHHYPQGSLQENLLHFLAETEIVFGLWASVMFLAYAAAHRSIHHAVEYIETQLNFTEPKFVLVVMVVAATRPVVQLAERLILSVARLLPLKENVSFYIATLSFGSLLGSFITEPAAMTLLAMLLKQRYFDRGISSSLPMPPSDCSSSMFPSAAHSHISPHHQSSWSPPNGNGASGTCSPILAGDPLPPASPPHSSSLLSTSNNSIICSHPQNHDSSYPHG